MQNPLFNQIPYNKSGDRFDFISNLSSDFRSRCLFYKIKDNLGELLVNIEAGDFKTFLQNKNSNNNFLNVLKFYIKYYENKKHIPAIINLLGKLTSKYLIKIFEKGYIEKSDYEDFVKQKNITDFPNKESSNYYFQNVARDYEKSLKDFSFAKKFYFLDYSKDSEKIYINIELFIILLQFLDTKNIGEKEQFYIVSLMEIYEIFTDTNNSDYTATVKGLELLFNKKLDLRFSKSDNFFLTIYNTFLSERKLLESDLLEAYNNLKSGFYIRKKVLNIFEVTLTEFYSNDNFLYLWLNKMLFIDVDSDREIYFLKSIYEETFEKYKNGDLKTYETKNIDIGEIISKDISSLYLENYKINCISHFLNTSNINKKNIKTTSKDISNYNDVSYLLDDGIDGIFRNLFIESRDNFQYHIFLEPLSLASKKYINSNIGYQDSYTIVPDIEKIIDEYRKKYEGKFLDIDDFIDDIFEKNIKLFRLSHAIKSRMLDIFSRKMDNRDTLQYVFSEKQIFKRILVYLAGLGFFDLAGKMENKSIIYASGNGYGWSYGYSDNEVTISIFEPKYISFKEIKLNKEFPKDNYISASEIFLSLNTKDNILKELAKFSFLDKIDSHIVLNITRDTLIKAKNTFSIVSKDIFAIFEKLNLKLPKNIELLISSIDNQKSDVEIFPAGIPVFCENLGIFNEFIKLKMFSEYILYKDEYLKFIIFSDKFKNLESLLTKRKVVFSKKKK